MFTFVAGLFGRDLSNQQTYCKPYGIPCSSAHCLFGVKHAKVKQARDEE